MSEIKMKNLYKEESQKDDEETLKDILENNSSYTKDALIYKIKFLKQKGNISELVLKNYSVEKLVELILTRKDYIPEIKEILDTIFKKNPNKFEEVIKSEKQSSGEVDLIISGVKVIDTKRDLIGNIFITDKNIYFITAKILNRPDIIFSWFGALGILTGGVITKLTNKYLPKIFEKTDDIPLNILTKYIDGSFKIELSNILLVRINNKNNHFVLKIKDNNQWSYHFFAANPEDREKIRETFHKYNINVEPAKGFLKTLMEVFKKKK